MRHPQQVSSDSIFKKCADSTRSTTVRCGCTCTGIKAFCSCIRVAVCLPMFFPNKTATALSDSEASLEKKPQEALCLHQQVMSPQQVPVVSLVSIPCSNISHLHVLSIPVQCPHMHNTLGWLEVFPIICSASS